MSDFTQLREELEKLDATAVTAPWKIKWDYGNLDDDAEFIVTMRNNLPTLLHALRVAEAAPPMEYALVIAQEFLDASGKTNETRTLGNSIKYALDGYRRALQPTHKEQE